jgi:hypothetical protein
MTSSGVLDLGCGRVPDPDRRPPPPPACPCANRSPRPSREPPSPANLSGRVRWCAYVRWPQRESSYQATSPDENSPRSRSSGKPRRKRWAHRRWRHPGEFAIIPTRTSSCSASRIPTILSTHFFRSAWSRGPRGVEMIPSVVPKDTEDKSRSWSLPNSRGCAQPERGLRCPARCACACPSEPGPTTHGHALRGRGVFTINISAQGPSWVSGSPSWMPSTTETSNTIRRPSRNENGNHRSGLPFAHRTRSCSALARTVHDRRQTLAGTLSKKARSPISFERSDP